MKHNIIFFVCLITAILCIVRSITVNEIAIAYFFKISAVILLMTARKTFVTNNQLKSFKENKN